MLGLHKFDLEFGWGTCIFCKIQKWFNPNLWEEFKKGEVTLDEMKKANNFKRY
jgi:hypothetical protein